MVSEICNYTHIAFSLSKKLISTWIKAWLKAKKQCHVKLSYPIIHGWSLGTYLSNTEDVVSSKHCQRGCCSTEGEYSSFRHSLTLRHVCCFTLLKNFTKTLKVPENICSSLQNFNYSLYPVSQRQIHLETDWSLLNIAASA